MSAYDHTNVLPTAPARSPRPAGRPRLPRTWLGSFLSLVRRAPIHDFSFRDEILDQYLRLSPRMDVLEVGPGSGFTALRLAQRVRQLVLVDVATSPLHRSARSFLPPNVSFVRWDANRPGLDSEIGFQFDAAFGLDVFEFIFEPAAFLRNLAAVLRPGGALLLTFPNVPWPEGHGAIYFDDPSVLRTLIRRAGFSEWEIFSVRQRPGAARMYTVLHDWPSAFFRRFRERLGGCRPASYDSNWVLRHRRMLSRCRILANLCWPLLARAMRLGGPVFVDHPVTDGILNRQLVIRAWK